MEGIRRRTSNAGAMSYSVNGRQYVTIAAGSSLFAYALPQAQ